MKEDHDDLRDRSREYRDDGFMWSLTDAVKVVRGGIAKLAFDNGYNLCLGGGVLDRGYSHHDLDLVLVPRIQVDKHDQEAIVKEMTAWLWTVTHSANLPGRRVVRFMSADQAPRRLELIFLDHDEDAAPRGEPVPDTPKRSLVRYRAITARTPSDLAQSVQKELDNGSALHGEMQVVQPFAIGLGGQQPTFIQVVLTPR